MSAANARHVNLSGGQNAPPPSTPRDAGAGAPNVSIPRRRALRGRHETEAAILRTCAEALKGRTAIVVSHRITAVRDADLILVLERGRIVETGRHEELFARPGRYWELLRRQQLEESLQQV